MGRGKRIKGTAEEKEKLTQLYLFSLPVSNRLYGGEYSMGLMPSTLNLEPNLINVYAPIHQLEEKNLSNNGKTFIIPFQCLSLAKTCGLLID